MSVSDPPAFASHSHVFLGDGHERGERKTWAVIWLCGIMMLVEIGAGLLFGSIALVADGLHMSTHAGALLLAAIAYTYARKHAEDPRFTFGTGKIGDLAGFTSAIVLAMIALLIAYEAAQRLFAPAPIDFAEAIPVACLGLAVNLASAWLLSGDGHSHGHPHGGHAHHDEAREIATDAGPVLLEIFEDQVPPRFRLQGIGGQTAAAGDVEIEIVRPDGARQKFAMADRGAYVESIEAIPEPHAFEAHVRLNGRSYLAIFEEHEHGAHGAGRDNNLRAALVHVVADAAVSVLVIAGLLLAQIFGWLWMDPLVGLAGAAVIASWAFTLIRDTGAILLDMNPDAAMTARLRATIEAEGDRVADLHVWRLGPGHLGAIVSVLTLSRRGVEHYRARLARFRALSHLTIEVRTPA